MPAIAAHLESHLVIEFPDLIRGLAPPATRRSRQTGAAGSI
jgi:hypothetical protein